VASIVANDTSTESDIFGRPDRREERGRPGCIRPYILVIGNIANYVVGEKRSSGGLSICRFDCFHI
jgi:hypothetical protein